MAVVPPSPTEVSKVGAVRVNYREHRGCDGTIRPLGAEIAKMKGMARENPPKC